MSGAEPWANTDACIDIPSGNITAIDNHRPFIEIVKKNDVKTGYNDRIKCIVKDMKVMDFAKESF